MDNMEFLTPGLGDGNSQGFLVDDDWLGQCSENLHYDDNASFFDMPFEPNMGEGGSAPTRDAEAADIGTAAMFAIDTPIAYMGTAEGSVSHWLLQCDEELPSELFGNEYPWQSDDFMRPIMTNDEATMSPPPSDTLSTSNSPDASFDIYEAAVPMLPHVVERAKGDAAAFGMGQRGRVLPSILFIVTAAKDTARRACAVQRLAAVALGAILGGHVHKLLAVVQTADATGALTLFLDAFTRPILPTLDASVREHTGASECITDVLVCTTLGNQPVDGMERAAVVTLFQLLLQKSPHTSVLPSVFDAAVGILPEHLACTLYQRVYARIHPVVYHGNQPRSAQHLSELQLFIVQALRAACRHVMIQLATVIARMAPCAAALPVLNTNGALLSELANCLHAKRATPGHFIALGQLFSALPVLTRKSYPVGASPMRIPAPMPVKRIRFVDNYNLRPVPLKKTPSRPRTTTPKKPKAPRARKPLISKETLALPIPVSPPC